MIEANALVNGVRLHYRKAGDGPLMVLLHGWPQTGYCWRRVIEPLAADYTVLAPDLRGYGRSDKPLGGYDKRGMAADIRALVTHLRFDRVVLVGHDRGARVAHRYALDAPDEVDALVVMDIVPTREIWARMDVALARKCWHWLFHLQPDLPELLVGGNVEAYVRYFLERWTVNRHAFDEAAIEHYVQALRAPGALRAGFDDYRASFPDDCDDDEADFAAGRRLTMPVLALWGQDGLYGQLPTLDIWRGYADDVRGAAIADCGHFLAEERPDAVVAELRQFLGERSSSARSVDA